MKTLVFALILFLPINAYAQVDFERLADSIYIAEGGAKTSHPYGIMAKFKHTSPRQACLNTLASNWRKWLKQPIRGQDRDFIAFLGRTYAPIGAKNDPSNLNSNWVKNVTKIYLKKMYTESK